MEEDTFQSSSETFLSDLENMDMAIEELDEISEINDADRKIALDKILGDWNKPITSHTDITCGEFIT